MSDSVDRLLGKFGPETVDESVDRCKELTAALIDTLLKMGKKWAKDDDVDERLMISTFLTAATMFAGDVLSAAVHDDIPDEKLERVIDEGAERIAKGAKAMALLNMKLIKKAEESGRIMGDDDAVRH